MTSFLNNTAEKEEEARSKLEVFIANLVERTAHAEEELKRLKSIETVNAANWKKLNLEV